ncbi:uncharacterized protein CC84DRAFT_1184240 [Paraphaeosphaeria sporulosa]|uniref:Uncharacterized protein n=1 Tax=Paraphaeosphaeria sporulosa TaxID=1460663 RepID=A0A177CS38_9PLEO|nr:uncharacterized protein CC84DRAFT_1184240 [Paraphaeosphaeria sporulosa]OAG10106.1 hypothetical protein CC84DRAFT_1184240 [Paraphaeosphaeria sporulosa]
MSVDGNPLRRSSWKAEAIRRGDLKISGPIPITEDVPLSDEEVKDFEKHGTLSPKLPQDIPVAHPTQHFPGPPLAPPPAAPVLQGELYPQTPIAPEDESEKQEKFRSSPPQQLSVPMQTTPERHRRSATEPMPISPIPPTPETPTRAATRKKRKSGLRNVFRKMFGRKSREELDEDEGQLPQRSQTQRQSQRASPTPMNPLGQHLPFPMNVNAPQEVSPPHDYLRFEMPTPNLSRRRATLPNVHGISETQSLNGPEKRLDTWEERLSGEYIPSPEIGVALSSPPGERQSTQSVQEKRRSRSAGNLREMTKGRPSVERRRSAEIRYWRSSYASGSVYSTNTPRPRTAQTVETVRSIEAQGELPELSEMVTKAVSVHAPTVVTQHDHDHDTSQVPLPVEAFNFGNFRSDFSDDDDSEQPAEGPAAPSAHPERRLSIEDRVKHLEENMRSLDASVRRMSGRSNRQTIILDNAPKGRRSRNRSSSASSQRQGSHHSSKGSHNTLHLRQYEDEKPAPGSPAHPPLSAVNELPVSNAAQEGVADIHAQLAALQSSLQHERYARKALEAQVSTLQRDLADLHNLVHKFVSAASPSYPTPSPDAIIASNEASTPRASELRGRERAISESSTDDGDDMVSPDDWATPKESTHTLLVVDEEGSTRTNAHER